MKNWFLKYYSDFNCFFLNLKVVNVVLFIVLFNVNLFEILKLFQILKTCKFILIVDIIYYLLNLHIFIKHFSSINVVTLICLTNKIVSFLHHRFFFDSWFFWTFIFTNCLIAQLLFKISCQKNEKICKKCLIYFKINLSFFLFKSSRNLKKCAAHYYVDENWNETFEQSFFCEKNIAICDVVKITFVSLSCFCVFLILNRWWTIQT